MKKGLLCLLCGLFFTLQFAKAQQVNDLGKLADEPIAMVKKHYTDLQLEEIRLKTPVKMKLLNYLYSGSYRIINQEGNPVKTDAASFDIHNYDRFRKQDKRVVFRLTREGDALELFSRDEVEVQNQLIINSAK
jgi:hypothetical protein